MKKIKRYLITGFVVLVPFALTIYILVTVFNFVDGILGKYLNAYFKELLGFYIPGLGILLFFGIIITAGFLATRFIGRRIFPQLEKLFSRIPIIDKVYPTVKQIVLFVLAQQEFGFKKVVLAEYPSKGIWSLGFITNEEFKKISEVVNCEMTPVFIPTTPGPFSGFLIFLPKEAIKFVDISVGDALKIIISGGVFKP